MASFTKAVNPRFAKRPLKTNGCLANRGLTSLVKEVTSMYQRGEIDIVYIAFVSLNATKGNGQIAALHMWDARRTIVGIIIQPSYHKYMFDIYNRFAFSILEMICEVESDILMERYQDWSDFLAIVTGSPTLLCSYSFRSWFRRYELVGTLTWEIFCVHMEVYGKDPGGWDTPFLYCRKCTLVIIPDLIIDWIISKRVRQHIEAETKCPPPYRRHFQMRFLEWNSAHFYVKFAKVCPPWSINNKLIHYLNQR